jgi:hypothetical protein
MSTRSLMNARASTRVPRSYPWRRAGPIRQPPLADLDAADPDREESARQLGGVLDAARAAVGDGVNGRESKSQPEAVAAKRSMKWVESLPAMKSGSSRIRRCSGIVVLMPSTTKKSSARRPRPIASSRSRPQTMSLAISES